MEIRKNIDVVAYDVNWPKMFAIEAEKIQKALGNNCIAVHHVGSTAVPGLISKPKIDILTVVKDGNATIRPLENIGFVYKGEWNIPFKFGFTRRTEPNINLHVLEENHPEIELNLIFREHLRMYPESLQRYAKLKEDLLVQESSFMVQDGALFHGYNLGKDEFIRNLLISEGYAGHRFLRVTHHKEWEAYHRIKKEQIFDPIDVVYDYTHPSVKDPANYHFVLTRGLEIATVAHVEFLNETEAALRTLATDIKFKNQGYGTEMMHLLEQWLRLKGIKLIKMHSRLSAVPFYKNLGYNECFFDDQAISEEHLDLGKSL